MTAASAGALPSPCVKLCRLDGNGMCLGCFRSIDEIAAWPSADDAMRRAILARCAGRRRTRTEPTE
ncbi:DUF1289 domain-containing protein [Roseomonas sp. SSH11]|uniref:DUF1289 domain-containing protein n=1 Tax=Pararoseomonas baculiformis TaxID=2820812 RepID=A0ABS4AB65_9PROT|nr:DUF1289 domain-containing protein [Pararoseomonas baculiformis]MBP0444243.1 DUF1289 domain-containing protein [Pararoseomonas baculiformis]